MKIFYGAAFNLLASYYKHCFATHLSPNDLQVVHHIDTQGIFSMYFGLSSTSEINAETFHDPTETFFKTVWNAVSEQELSGIWGEKTGSGDSPIFILRSGDMTDLLLLAERLLKDYDIILELCDFAGLTKRHVGQTTGFNFEDIYTLPHVRALHSHAKGLSVEGQGLQLSH